MKRQAILIATFLAFQGAVLANEAHHPAAPHMKLMREQMAQIRAATDPKEKERLLAEHFRTMEESMSRMQGMGCAKM